MRSRLQQQARANGGAAASASWLRVGALGAAGGCEARGRSAQAAPLRRLPAVVSGHRTRPDRTNTILSIEFPEMMHQQFSIPTNTAVQRHTQASGYQNAGVLRRRACTAQTPQTPQRAAASRITAAHARGGSASGHQPLPTGRSVTAVLGFPGLRLLAIDSLRATGHDSCDHSTLMQPIQARAGTLTGHPATYSRRTT